VFRVLPVLLMSPAGRIVTARHAKRRTGTDWSPSLFTSDEDADALTDQLSQCTTSHYEKLTAPADARYG